MAEKRKIMAAIAIALTGSLLLSCNFALPGDSRWRRFSIVETVPGKSGERLPPGAQVQVSFSRKCEAKELGTVLKVTSREGEVRGSWSLADTKWIFTPALPYRDGMQYYLSIEDPLHPSLIRFTCPEEEEVRAGECIRLPGFFPADDPDNPVFCDPENGSGQSIPECQVPDGALPCILCSESCSTPELLAEALVQDPEIDGTWYAQEHLLRFYPASWASLPDEWTLYLQEEPLVHYRRPEKEIHISELILSGETQLNMSAPFGEGSAGTLQSGSADGGITITILFSREILEDQEKEDILDRISIQPIFPEGSPYPVLTGLQWLSREALFLSFRGCLSHPPGKKVHYQLLVAPGEQIEPRGSAFLFEVSP